MNTKEFMSRFESICEKHEAQRLQTHSDCYLMNTPFGSIRLTSLPSPKIKNYSITMRFLEKDKFNQQLFNDTVRDGHTTSSGLKWNLHGKDPEDILDTFDERMDNLRWLMNPKNTNLVKK